MTSSVDTMRSASVGLVVKEKKKEATQPPGILQEQHPQLFPPPRPIIRTLDTDQLDTIDAQQTIKEAAKRRRPTIEEIRRLEKELVEEESNARNNLRWHNEDKAEKAKVETL